MNNQIEDFALFPIFIRYAKNVLSEENCVDIINQINLEDFKKHGALSGNALSSYRSMHNKLIEFMYQRYNLDKIILSFIDNYSTFYGIPKLKMGRIWINIQNPGSELLYHTHPSSVVSGALYLNVDEKSSRIHFINPNPFCDFLEYFNQPLHSTQFNLKKFSISPSIGSMVLFPSWFKHGSDDVNQTEQRIVISFNAVYDSDNIP